MDKISNIVEESSSEIINSIRTLFHIFNKDYFQDRIKKQEELIKNNPDRREFHEGVRAGLIDAQINFNNLL